jgi:hypothetical protein
LTICQRDAELRLVVALIRHSDQPH